MTTLVSCFETAKDLIREKSFLDVERRSREVGHGELVSVDIYDATCEFSIVGLTDTYTCYVRILDLVGAMTFDMTIDEIARIIEDSDLEVACTCPAFLYWGFQYVTAIERAGYWVASLDPNIRNPQLKGGGCKHLHRILSEWDDYIYDIAREFPHNETRMYSRKEIKALVNKLDHKKVKLCGSDWAR